MFGDPSPGDIWVQLAQIIKTDGDKYEVALSNENGGFDNSSQKISKELFHTYYFSNPLDPQNYLKKVQIIEIHDEDASMLIADLDLNNNQLKTRKLGQKAFKKSFHLDQVLAMTTELKNPEPLAQAEKNPATQNLEPDEEAIIDLDEDSN
ncbi:MAG: hypothetical protein A2Y82_00220 [Candidatus Buchananbacteria bacterium RBG_13_36_9]|uniref:Uncharacterized protein n=1 Tax=Candidatus Buchananbacteria bacterium RBG_13_36_9 TaxID=1797530 RepID=A0A1G1XN04_9BACT|nr:MAG: hypothetical protein A2Y82_00220 [Candidatus Buchananbacteria bacterium RBG_13_36_9]